MSETRQWSYSSLSKYESCPLRYYLNKIEELEDKPGHAAMRGTKIHEQIEEYLRFSTNGLPDLVESSFGEELDRAREASAEPEVAISLTEDWERCDWDDGWVRGKIDMLIPDKSIIVDFKTGRYYPTHRDQASLYALISMAGGYTEDAYVEFWFLDNDDVVTWEFTRRMLPKLKEKWAFKAKQLQDETEWKATPNRFCKWCSFNANKGGQCVY